MEIKVKEIQEEIQADLEKQKESNTKATDRISEELRAEKKLEERRRVVMDYFFELTGMPMPLNWFEEYNEIFNEAEKGYNLGVYIWYKQQDIYDYFEQMKPITEEVTDDQLSKWCEEREKICE